MTDTYKGVDVDYLKIIYDAVCNKGIDINSDATKAFYEGAKYGAKCVDQAIKDAMYTEIVPAITKGFMEGTIRTRI